MPSNIDETIVNIIEMTKSLTIKTILNLGQSDFLKI